MFLLIVKSGKKKSAGLPACLADVAVVAYDVA